MGARADRPAKGNGNEEGTYAQKERERERSLVRSGLLSVRREGEGPCETNEAHRNGRKGG